MNTAKLNSILGRLSKGVGNSRILPITEYMKLQLTSGLLEIVATNSANFITYTEKGVEGEDGIAIVKADKLVKLASKTSKKQIVLELKETHLEFKGNGTYKIELFETNEYPTFEFNQEIKGAAVKTSVLRKAFAVNKSAIATEMLMPCLTGYNVGANVVTTDGVKMALNETSIFASEQRALIPQGLADLLANLSDEEVFVQKEGNKLLFSTEHYQVFGTELEGMDEYPDISGITGLEFANYSIVDKQPLQDALDRLTLFADQSTNYGVRLTFKAEGLLVEDLKRNSQETLEYVEKSQTEESVELIFNLNYLSDILGALTKGQVKVFYANDYPLKLQEENVILVLSTMTPEE